ncbi:MAG: DUF3078 domain-containing protein [Bacteroidota bacterium]
MNKKLIFIVAILISGTSLFAQDAQLQDTVWRINGDFALNLNQVTLTNWAAGGQNSFAWNATAGLDANYAKDKWKWDNAIRLGYGLLRQGEDPINKTDDQILINTNLGYQMKGAWYATLNANFRTQFTNGYDLPGDSVISTFMAPAYLVSGLGFEYKPNDNFRASLSPTTNKTTFVMDDALSALGAYGVDAGSNVRAEFGAFLTLAYKKEILKNVNFETLYTMFGNYQDLAAWDINWDMIFDFKINNFLSANLTTNLIYDQDIDIPVDSTGDGVNDTSGPRVQFRESFGIGLKANFSGVK